MCISGGVVGSRPDPSSGAASGVMFGHYNCGRPASHLDWRKQRHIGEGTMTKGRLTQPSRRAVLIGSASVAAGLAAPAIAQTAAKRVVMASVAPLDFSLISLA